MRGILLRLLAELGVDIEEPRDDIGQRTGCNDNEEEGPIAHGLLQSSGKEAWNHHGQCHESRAEGIVGGFVLALTIINKVEHVGRESEAIAELLDEDADIDDKQTVGQDIGEIDVDEVGQRDGQHHRPQPAFQSVATGGNTAENATQRQSDDTYSTLNETVFTITQAETAIMACVDKEEGTDLCQQSLWHTSADFVISIKSS